MNTLSDESRGGLTFVPKIDLGPDLPLAVFTSTEHWHPERIGALAIYCSDGRWGEAFDEFCHRHLQIPRYDRLAVAGGPAWLAPREGGTAGKSSHQCHARFTSLRTAPTGHAA